MVFTENKVVNHSLSKRIKFRGIGALVSKLIKWKIEKFSRTEKIFREININSLETSLSIEYL